MKKNGMTNISIKIVFLGLGIVIRDSKWIVLASCSEKVSLPPSSDNFKALATVRALLFAQELGLSSLIFKGDSEFVIKVLRSEDESLASFGHFLESVKPTIDAFSSISFSHTRKLGNFVAHNLAKHARHARDLLVWSEDAPSHFHDVLLADNG